MGKQTPEPDQEASEVVAGASEDGVDRIAGTMRQIIPPDAMLGFEMADDGLDRRSAFQGPLDLRRDAPLLALDAEAIRLGRVVTAIAGIGNDAADDIADLVLHLRNDDAERVAIASAAAAGPDGPHKPRRTTSRGMSNRSGEPASPAHD